MGLLECNLNLEIRFNLLVQLNSKTQIQWNSIKMDPNWVFTLLLYWFMSNLISLGHTVALALFYYALKTKQNKT